MLDNVLWDLLAFLFCIWLPSSLDTPTDHIGLHFQKSKIRKALKAKENAFEYLAFFCIFFNVTQLFKTFLCDIPSNHEHHWPENYYFSEPVTASSAPELCLLQYAEKTIGGALWFLVTIFYYISAYISYFRKVIICLCFYWQHLVALSWSGSAAVCDFDFTLYLLLSGTCLHWLFSGAKFLCTRPCGTEAP